MTGHVPFSNLKNDLQVSVAIAGGQLPSKPTTLDDEDKKNLWSICRICWRASPKKRLGMSWILDVLPPDPGIKKLSVPFPTLRASDPPVLPEFKQTRPLSFDGKPFNGAVEREEVRPVSIPTCIGTLSNEYFEGWP